MQPQAQATTLADAIGPFVIFLRTIQAMTGVDTSGDGGVTLPELNLLRGYYRTSAESQNVLKCYQEEACIGGTDVSQYCQEGYRGACKTNPSGILHGFCFNFSTTLDATALNRQLQNQSLL